jgi:hypothetical protein
MAYIWLALTHACPANKGVPVRLSLEGAARQRLHARREWFILSTAAACRLSDQPSGSLSPVEDRGRVGGSRGALLVTSSAGSLPQVVTLCAEGWHPAGSSPLREIRSWDLRNRHGRRSGSPMECLNLDQVQSVSRLLLRLLLSHATRDQASGGVGEDPRGSNLAGEVSTSDGWSWMAQRCLRVEHPRIAHHLVCVRAARCWLPRGIEARKDPAKK